MTDKENRRHFLTMSSKKNLPISSRSSKILANLKTWILRKNLIHRTAINILS